MSGVAKPYWHFDHDPSNAEEMKPLLKLLSDAKIPWTFGSQNPFNK